MRRERKLEGIIGGPEQEGESMVRHNVDSWGKQWTWTRQFHLRGRDGDSEVDRDGRGALCSPRALGSRPWVARFRKLPQR